MMRNQRQEPQYDDRLPPPRDDMLEPKYESDDMVADYGSIIKDLTDTEDLLLRLELRLLGMGQDENNKLVKIRKPYMTTEKARDFIDQIRSIVNQNTHFSKLPQAKVDAILESAASEIPRWLMQQGMDVPLKNRSTINFIAFNLIMESCYKANEGTILRWTKGSFKEGSMNDKRDSKRGIMDFILGRKKK